MIQQVKIQEFEYDQVFPRLALYEMVQSFYSEYDSNGLGEVDIERTIRHFNQYPDAGRILLIFKEEHIIGYAILVNFWSNEYGGTILFIDELFVKKEYRQAGIGTKFFQWIEQEYTEAKILALEVSPKNAQAAKLYHSLGFYANKNATLYKIQSGK